jgi:hypothetical protein
MLDYYVLSGRRTGFAYFLTDTAVLGTRDTWIYVIVCMFPKRPKAVQVVAQTRPFAASQFSDHS